LFRHVLDLAADASGLSRRTFPDRDFEEMTKIELGAHGAAIKKKINDLGRTLSPPWRRDEKQAATAAWLVLRGRPK